MLSCPVLHLSIRFVSEDMQCCMKGYVLREHSLYIFCLWGIQRDLEAGEPGNEVKDPLLREVLGDSWI